MKRHWFDPFSFVFGALFLTVGATFLFGAGGAAAVKPSHLWPATVVVIGSTPGRATAIAAMTTYPRRRFRRSLAVVRMPSRTSASTKIGSSKTTPTATSATITNE